MKNSTKRLFTALWARNWRRLVGPTIGVCVLAVLLATGAGADTTLTTYYACVNMKSGAIYMVNEGDTCKNNYTLISWNQVGPQGPQGPAGLTQKLSVQEVSAAFVIPEGQVSSVDAQCPAGTFLTGGGFVTPRSSTAVAVILVSRPDVANNEWMVTASAPVVNTGNAEFILEVFALCASLA